MRYASLLRCDGLSRLTQACELLTWESSTSDRKGQLGAGPKAAIPTYYALAHHPERPGFRRLGMPLHVFM